ncbi:hypothetical protein HK102_006118 [Quaeritorhiza haematococci]|nr:hypothetical protein HK102_006118 [Quaeritorhiza haematococci]
MVAIKSLIAGLLLLVSPASAAIIHTTIDTGVFNSLQRRQYTKVGARVTCERTYDYTHNDQKDLIALSERLTITTDRCKRDPWDYNRPGKFVSLEFIAYKDNGERIVCGVHPGTGLKHPADVNPPVDVRVSKCA